jgi:hypothetical protein
MQRRLHLLRRGAWIASFEANLHDQRKWGSRSTRNLNYIGKIIEAVGRVAVLMVAVRPNLVTYQVKARIRTRVIFLEM